jgi:hypothetical protein
MADTEPTYPTPSTQTEDFIAVLGRRMSWEEYEQKRRTESASMIEAFWKAYPDKEWTEDGVRFILTTDERHGDYHVSVAICVEPGTTIAATRRAAPAAHRLRDLVTRFFGGTPEQQLIAALSHMTDDYTYRELADIYNRHMGDGGMNRDILRGRIRSYRRAFGGK